MVIKRCLLCKLIFEAKNPIKLYCSNKCIKRINYVKHRKLLNRNKICNFCNKTFLDDSLNNKFKYCSDLCKNRYYRKNRLLTNPDYEKLQYIKHRDNRITYNKIYNKTYKRDIDKSYLSTKTYRKNNPEKYKAHMLVKIDKKKNLYLYPEICMICGETKNIDFHHPDYNFPYSVYPLCKKHHKEIHQNIKNKK